MATTSKKPPSASCETVAAAGENRLVRLLTRGLPQTARTLCGPGDDCAVLRGPRRGNATLFKTDALVAGIHFTMETDAARVGWKALCRNISDIAAMGGSPQEALVTLALPPELPVRWVQRLYAGMRRAAVRFGCGIAGGETTSVPAGAPVMISVAMLGTVKTASLVLRSGGRPGDLICVTGRLGGSISGRHLDFIPRLEEARWLVQHAKPTAMMDLSDGLAKDLPRLADASQTGYRIDPAALPCHRGCSTASAIGDGEDYELLCTLPPAKLRRVRASWRTAFPRVPLTIIGELLPDTNDRTPLTGGWEHFRLPQ